MKIMRFLTTAVMLLGLTGVAQAITFRVLDPTGSQPSAPNVTQFGVPVPFSFYSVDCPGGAEGCFDAVNHTGTVITFLSATFMTNTLLPQTDLNNIDCPTDAFGGLTSFSNNITCLGSASGTNDSFTVTFDGGGVQPFSSFWIVEDGIPASDFNDPAGTFTVGGAVPEPASLWMALTGLAPLGYALRRRRGAARA